MRDLHILPKVRDSWSFLYVEHCRIDQEAKAISIHDAKGKVAVPCASLATLMIGPGTTVTHAAVKALGDNGCLVVWTGEEGIRFYAQGLGETRSARNVMRQASLWADAHSRLEVVMRMYRLRFTEPLSETLTLEQVRGLEGVRVRQAYAVASRESGVPWAGRNYDRKSWQTADPVNRALSQANACLYGVCHAAIVSAGYSTALGFIHTGKMLSFVYDVADFYKAEMTVPVAFRAAAGDVTDLERNVRRGCREAFHVGRLLQRVLPDIERVLGPDAAAGEPTQESLAFDTDAGQPGGLWDGGNREVPGGISRGEEPGPEGE